MHLTLLHVPNLVFNVIFIVEAIFIFGLFSFSEISPNGQCSKIINFNRTKAGLTSKWGRAPLHCTLSVMWKSINVYAYP